MAINAILTGSPITAARPRGRRVAPDVELLELLESEEPRIRLGAARAILGMAGVASNPGVSRYSAPYPPVLVGARTVVQGARAVERAPGESILPPDFEL